MRSEIYVPTELEKVRDASLLRPEPMPTRSEAEQHFDVALFEPRAFLDKRKKGFGADERASMLATAQWLHWRGETLQQNRSRFGAVLWAFTQLHVVETDVDRRKALAVAVADALKAFGWPKSTPVPYTWQERRLFVEAWGTEAFRFLCQDARERGAA